MKENFKENNTITRYNKNIKHFASCLINLNKETLFLEKAHRPTSKSVGKIR